MDYINLALKHVYGLKFISIINTCIVILLIDILLKLQFDKCFYDINFIDITELLKNANLWILFIHILTIIILCFILILIIKKFRKALTRKRIRSLSAILKYAYDYKDINLISKCKEQQNSNKSFILSSDSAVIFTIIITIDFFLYGSIYGWLSSYGFNHLWYYLVMIIWCLFLPPPYGRTIDDILDSDLIQEYDNIFPQTHKITNKYQIIFNLIGCFMVIVLSVLLVFTLI